MSENNKLRCQICGREFKNFIGITNHITRTHKLKPQVYYDQYFNINNEEVCEHPNCSNLCSFLSIKNGYSECCSSKCSNNLPHRLLDHRNRTKKLWENEEYSNKMSLMKKEHWKDEEFRKLMTTSGLEFRNRQAKKISELYKNEEYRKLHSDIVKDRWKEESYRDIQYNSKKELYENEEYRKLHSDIAKERWKEESYKERVIKGIKTWWKNNPNERLKVSKRNKKLWKNNEYRNKVLTNLRKTTSMEEYKEFKRQIALEIAKDPEWRKSVSEGTIRGWNKVPEQKERQRQYMLNGGSVHAASFINNPSKPQIELFNLCCELLPYPILNYPVIELNKSIDIAIPQLSIAIEYDGSYWHQDKKSDIKRQKQLEELGWKFVRYEDVIPTKKELLKDIIEII